MASITVIGTNANPPKVHLKFTHVTVEGNGFMPGVQVKVTVDTPHGVIGPVLVDVDAGGQIFLNRRINRVPDDTQLSATAEQAPQPAITASATGDVRSEL